MWPATPHLPPRSASDRGHAKAQANLKNLLKSGLIREDMLAEGPPAASEEHPGFPALEAPLRMSYGRRYLMQF